jgi:hypothetical protein
VPYGDYEGLEPVVDTHLDPSQYGCFVGRQLELVPVERPALPALEGVFDEEDTELFFVVGGAVALAVGVVGLAGTFARRRLSGAGRM